MFYTIDLLLGCLVGVIYIGVGYFVMVLCERYEAGMQSLVGPSFPIWILAWAIWPMTASSLFFMWYSERALHIDSDAQDV